jgi:hypothetical protein
MRSFLDVPLVAYIILSTASRTREELLRQVIRQQGGRYGKNHPIVLRSQVRHALICLDRGYLDEAEEEMKIVVQRREEVLTKGYTLIYYTRI